MDPPFSSLVSKVWARTTGHMKYLDSLHDGPADFTILSLHIPNADIDPKHWDYLADDEAEDPVNLARDSAATGED